MTLSPVDPKSFHSANSSPHQTHEQHSNGRTNQKTDDVTSYNGNYMIFHINHFLSST